MGYDKALDRVIEWLDVRLGFSKTPLKPDPEYVLNPIYWLGALMAITFVLQGITGIFMLTYYTPTPDQAYSSTMYIMNSVPLGRLLETFHLYDAYAMILLAFMHLTRNYFSSAFKKPREFMWLAGMILGFVVLSFGLTGYLLPWTVVSKSATDVAIGMLNFIPGQLGGIAKFFITGSGSDPDEIRRFFDIHTIILPAALLVFLGIKVYLFEVHGPTYVSAFSRGSKRAEHWRILPWFPQIFLYGVMLGSQYIAALVAASTLFPLSLPPQYTPQAAAGYTAQPDWYFLWLYQILKLSFFEGSNIGYALVVTVVLMIVLFLLPFYDTGSKREMGSRPRFVTVGVIALAEFITLSVWGYLTPGQQIPSYQAIAVLGGIALLIAAASWFIRRVKSSIPKSTGESGPTKSALTVKPKESRIAFVFLLVIGSVAFASLVNALLSNAQLSLSLLFFNSFLLISSFSLMRHIMVKLHAAYKGGCSSFET